MTIVAPTAMIAKKLASVAVWISVYELRKLLTVCPVRASTCEPANTRQQRAEQQDHEDEPRLAATPAFVEASAVDEHTVTGSR